MKQIDHDPNEFTARKTAGIWWGCAALLAFVWATTLYLGKAIDWRSAGLGALTFGLILSWAYDITGGKVPASWRRKAPGSR